MRHHHLPISCEGCVLSTNPHCGKFTEVSGTGRTRVLIVAEASGKEEAKEGRPLIEWAPSGSIIEKAIRLGKRKRADFWMTNILRCRPPNNLLEKMPYEREAIDKCKGNLDRVVETVKPGAILALGGTALRELTGFSGGKKSVSYVRGYGIKSVYDVPVIGTFHPAYLARGNTRYLGLLLQDISEAIAYASGRKKLVDPNITVHTSIDKLEELIREARENPLLWPAYDIETTESLKGAEDEIIEREAGYGALDGIDDGDGDTEYLQEMGLGEEFELGFDEPARDSLRSHGLARISDQSSITSIQFAISATEGIYLKWDDRRVRELTREFSTLPSIVAWNGWMFDNIILKKHGVHIPISDDGMVMYKVIQPDLPAHLQAVARANGWNWPWKHLSHTNEEVYGVADVCSLSLIMQRLPNELRRYGMWEAYERFTKHYRHWVIEKMEQTGIPMSVERLNEFRAFLNTEIGRMFDAIEVGVPAEMHQRYPPKGYDNLPASIKEYVLAQHGGLFEPTTKVLKNGTIKLVKSKVKNQDIYKGICDGSLHHTEDGGSVSTLMRVLELYPHLRLGDFNGVPRLYEHVPFNPRSSKQVISYLKLKGYKVPKSFKEDKETTSDKEMLRLERETKDPILALGREIRIHSKMRDSYVGKDGADGVPVGGWIPDSDGRLRSKITFKSTWQLAATPNTMTMPKRRGEIAQKFQRCVKAEEGRVIVNFDYKSFHDLTTALEASDETRFRVAYVADLHALVAGHLVKYKGIETCMSMSDSDLKAFLIEVRQAHEDVREFQGKPLNHGTNFGQGYRRLYHEHRDHLKDENEAKRLLQQLKTIFPKTFEWQESLLRSLDLDNGGLPYLQSKWGARRWIWDAWAWKKNHSGQWYKTKGQDAEKALAFLPSNHAHGMLREKLLEMFELGYLSRYQLINSVHDALVFHPPLTLLDECITNVKEWMEAPVMTLAHPTLCPQGFICKVDVSYGPDMGSMTKLK